MLEGKQTAILCVVRLSSVRLTHSPSLLLSSFLRPKSVLEARAQYQSGKISDAELRKVEDTAIEHHVKQLLKNDVKAITDGEFRRQYFHIDFLKLLDGVTLESNSEFDYVLPSGAHGKKF